MDRAGHSQRKKVVCVTPQSSRRITMTMFFEISTKSSQAQQLQCTVNFDIKVIHLFPSGDGVLVPVAKIEESVIDSEHP